MARDDAGTTLRLEGDSDIAWVRPSGSRVSCGGAQQREARSTVCARSRVKKDSAARCSQDEEDSGRLVGFKEVWWRSVLFKTRQKHNRIDFTCPAQEQESRGCHHVLWKIKLQGRKWGF